MTPLVEMRDIAKSFPGVRALKGIDFEVRPGEVHALAGENGAGKSTLMHILAGVDRPDSGSFVFLGSPGVAIVYQERSLFDLLTVAENIFTNRQPLTSWGAIDRRAMERNAAAVLARLGQQINPRLPVYRLMRYASMAVEGVNG